MSSKIHRDVFSIFYSIWCNPQSKLFEIFRYLWNEAPANSRTWTVHIKNLSAQYQIPDLNKLLDSQPWKKETFKEFIITKIVAYKEAELRDEATRNSKMKFLNVSTLSLRGKPHPAIRGAGTTVEVKELRPAVKMLIGDYYTYALRASQVGGSGHCRLCKNPEVEEVIIHVLHCPSTAEQKQVTMPRLEEAVKKAAANINFQKLVQSPKTFSQFLLDCSSMNLVNEFRVNLNDPAIDEIFQNARKTINSIHSERVRKLKILEKMKT